MTETKPISIGQIDAYDRAYKEHPDHLKIITFVRTLTLEQARPLIETFNKYTWYMAKVNGNEEIRKRAKTALLKGLSDLTNLGYEDVCPYCKKLRKDCKSC